MSLTIIIENIILFQNVMNNGDITFLIPFTWASKVIITQSKSFIKNLSCISYLKHKGHKRHSNLLNSKTSVFIFKVGRTAMFKEASRPYDPHWLVPSPCPKKIARLSINDNILIQLPFYADATTNFHNLSG